MIEPTVNTIDAVTARAGSEVVRMYEHQLYRFGKVLLVRKNECVVCLYHESDITSFGTKKISMPVVFPAGGFKRNKVLGELYLSQLPAVEKPASDRAPRQRPADGQPSKISACRALYAANVSLTREQMIELFVKEGKCTPMGAVTYFSTCKKG